MAGLPALPFRERSFDLAGAPSAHLPGVMAALKTEGYRVEVRKVGYEFQAGGDQMLVLSAGG